MLGTSILDQRQKLKHKKSLLRPLAAARPSLFVREYTDDDVERELRSIPMHGAATWNFYDVVTMYLQNGAVDLDTDTIKVSIHSNGYTPSQTADDFFNDATNEVSGTGYTSGGKTLSSVALTLNTSTHLTKFSAADLTWTAVTFTSGRYAVMRKARGGASSADEVLGYVDFGTNITMAGGDFTISWNASGIWTLTRT